MVVRTVNVLDSLEGTDEQSISRDNDGKTEGLDESDVTNLTIERTEDPPDEAIPLDVVFDILRNRRRRLVLSAIEEWDGSTTLSELAEHIGGIENSKPPHALNAQERKRVYVGLYQCHLPKMDKLGVVEYDKNRGRIELQDSHQNRAILVTAGSVILLLSLGTLGVGALSSIPAVGWILLCLISIAAIVGLHYES